MTETPVERFIGRFADPLALDTFTIPGCYCPARTHESETITYRTELGDGEWESARAAGLMAAQGDYIDFAVANDAAMAKSVIAWTLLTNDPCQHPSRPHGKHEPLPISRRTMALLNDGLRQAILEHVKEAQLVFAGVSSADEESPPEESPPNASGRSSRASSRANASRTPLTRARE